MDKNRAYRIDEAPFASLCELWEGLERIKQIAPSNSSSPSKRSRSIALLSKWFSKHNGGSLYRLFRILLPELDFGRVFWLKERKLAPFIGRALGIEGTARGEELLAWRTNTDHLQRAAGDLSLVVAELVSQAEHCHEGTIRIGEVDQLLDQLAETSAKTSEAILAEGLARMTALECKWMVRLILKDLQLDLKPRIYCDAFHGLMWRVFSYQNDLKWTCEQMAMLLSRKIDLSALSDRQLNELIHPLVPPVLGINVAVMSCGRGQGIKHVAEKMRGKVCFGEYKYDGERLQAHLRDGQVIAIYSKSGRNSTEFRFRCLEQLKEAVQAENVILEGELLVFDERRGRIEPFGGVQDLGGHKSAARTDIGLEGRHYLIILFDLLHLDGRNLMREPLSERRRQLEQIIQAKPNFVEIAPIQVLQFGKTDLMPGLDDLHRLFAKAEADHQEGLIIKNADAPYWPGNRSEWLKLKRDYIPGFGDTLEMAVVGMSLGKGGIIRKLIMGAQSASGKSFILCFSVELGFTEEEKQLFHQNATTKAVRAAAGEMPQLPYTFEFAPGYREEIDWFATEPILVELLGSGFVRERGRPYWVLRFPRIHRVFFDRSFTDSITFEELQRLGYSSKNDEEEDGEEKEKIEQKIYASSSPHAQKTIKTKRPFRLSAEAKVKKPPLCLTELQSEYYIYIEPSERPDYASRIKALGLTTLHTMRAVNECRVRKVLTLDAQSIGHFVESLENQ